MMSGDVRAAANDDGVAAQRRYFETRADHYALGYDTTAAFRSRVQRAVAPHVTGRVLDVGNGGLLVFDPRLAESVTMIDLCPAALGSVHTAHAGSIEPVDELTTPLWRVAGSALEQPFADASFDVVVLAYVLHHLSARRRSMSRRNLGRALLEVARVLRRGGHTVIVECCPTRLPKVAQDVGWRLWCSLARCLGKPLPYFMGAAELERAVGAAGLRVTGRAEIAWDVRVHQPLFPAISPPGWLWEHLLQNRVFVAQRA